MRFLTSVEPSPSPEPDWVDKLSSFLPPGPNFDVFLSIAPAYQLIGAIILGAIALVSFMLILVNALMWLLSGKDVLKAGAAKSRMKEAFIWFAVSAVMWGMIMMVILSAARMVF